MGAGGFHLKPKRRRVATENAITKVNPMEPKRALFHCNYCQKDISNVVRIKCAVCAETDLCVECFSVGVEPHPHLACHAYHVIDNLSFPLFTMDWGADEELLLLEAIEMYGLGNWTEVSEHVGTKTKLQCHAHYFDHYVNSATTPLPDMSKVLGKDYVKGEVKEEGKGGSKDRNRGGGKGAGGAGGSGGGGGGEAGGEAGDKDGDDAAAAATITPAVADDDKEATLASFARPGDERHSGNCADLTGYNVKRDEFDPEYDVDAELPLAEMEFRDSDTELDRKLKLHMLGIYTHRLTERIRRKQFIIDRGLLNVKRQQGLERKRTPQERDLHGAVRVFARFLEPNEYEIMLEGLAAESRIRNRIAELKEYRRMGIHTLSEGELYDAEKRRRVAECARLQALDMPAGKNNVRTNRHLSRDGFVPTHASHGGNPGGGGSVEGGGGGSGGGSGGGGGMVGLSGGGRKKVPLPLDLTQLPGVELLSRREQDVCTNSRLLPVHYLSIKEALMRASACGEPLKRADVRVMFKVEPVKAVRVYELLLSNGWVQDGGGGGGAAGGSTGALKDDASDVAGDAMEA